MKSIKHLLGLVVLISFLAGSANAGVMFAGSWRVDAEPAWGVNPATYTGQEAAALLFGGTASDYQISTIDNTVANINNMAWHSIWGNTGGTMFAEDFKIDLGAPGYNAPGGTNSASSAFVTDHASGAQYTNYAFFDDANRTVPEPSSFAVFEEIKGDGGNLQQNGETTPVPFDSSTLRRTEDFFKHKINDRFDTTNHQRFR